MKNTALHLKLPSKLIALISCSFALAFSAPSTLANESAMRSVSPEQVTEVSFTEGGNLLSKSSQSDIDNLVMKFKKAGKIDDVKVLAWADREYPAEGEKADKKSVKLAERRSNAVKSYIKRVHKIGDVETYNMAERPNSMEKLFSTSDYKAKTSVENSGNAPAKEELNFLKTNAHQGKSLIVVTLTK